MNRAEQLDAARADPLAAWEASGRDAAALAAVMAGAAARAVALLEGDVADPDHQRLHGAVVAHATVAQMLATREADGLALAALDRESVRYAWRAIELAMHATRSAEMTALGRAALELFAGRPADEPLDRALARERLGVES
jgi:hypothetical protein